MNSKKRRTLAVAAAGAGLALVMAGCGAGAPPNSSGSSKSLTIMVAQGLYEGIYSGAFKNLLGDYQKETGTKVSFQVVPNLSETMKVKLATGGAPDMWIENVPADVPTFNATKNNLVLDDEPWAADLVNPDFYKWTDGHLYAFPLQAHAFFPGMYFNKEIFAKAGIADPHPTTMKEFWSILDTVKEKVPGVTTLEMANSDAGFAQYFVTIAGGMVMQDEATWEKLRTNKLKYADVPQLVQLMTDFKRLVDDYANKDNISSTRDTAFGRMARGEAAVMVADENVAQDLLTRNPKLDLGSYVIPYGDQDLGVTGTFVQGLWIHKQGNNVEAARDFVRWLAKPDHIGKWYKERPSYPSLKGVDAGDVPKSVSHIYDTYVAPGKYTQEMNSHMSYTQELFGTYLVKLYQQVLVGEVTPKEMWQQWDRNVADFMVQKGDPNWG